MARIVFMGTPHFAVPILQALIDTQTVAGVVTQPDRPAGRGQVLRPSPVKVLAQEVGVPLYQPASLRASEAAEPVRAWQPEAIVVAAYGQILRPHMLNLPPLGCLNVHASLLPRWRGASPIHHAILAGDPETGISLMQMDEGLDTGPVYVQEAIPIGPAETAATLHDRLAALGAAMVRRYLDAILAGEIRARAQDAARATYAPLIGKEDGDLDWTEPALALERRVRAMTPWPGASTWYNGERLRIVTAALAGGLSAPPGTVVDSGEGIVVAAGSGALRLIEVQPAGRRAMSIEAFINGHPDLVGSQLGKEQAARP
ncbi:MAG: methionyl-tRNA formyltransferase [Anaerolineae bacterium]|nr:methionyl-tRNA formyltransferase [Anaerolineae bacterium]